MGEGLKLKYVMTKADGRPVDPNGMYFVLKLNSDDPAHAHACQEAVLVYANLIEEHIPELARDLRTSVKQLRRDGEGSLQWAGRVLLEVEKAPRPSWMCSTPNCDSYPQQDGECWLCPRCARRLKEKAQ